MGIEAYYRVNTLGGSAVVSLVALFAMSDMVAITSLAVKDSLPDLTVIGG